MALSLNNFSTKHLYTQVGMAFAFSAVIFAFDEGGQGMVWLHSWTSIYEFVGLSTILVLMQRAVFPAIERKVGGEVSSLVLSFIASLAFLMGVLIILGILIKCLSA